MQQLQDSKRQRLLSIRCLSVLALIIASTVPIQAVAATATCNSDLDTRISGPGSPTDPIFLNEPITATARFKARDIAGGSHLSIPNFGFAADCNANSDGLTYDNCISPGNTVNYLGGIIVGDNCKNISNEKIKFPAPQSSFIDFIPLNGPVIIDENESCTISWEFEVTALREDSPDVPNLREVMYQATTFPLTDENEDAMCDNGLQAGESRMNFLIVSTCDIQVRKQICSPDLSAGQCTQEADWHDADSNSDALELSSSGLAAYRAIITNTGSVDYVDDIVVNDAVLGIKNMKIAGLAAGDSVTIGGASFQAQWQSACTSNTSIVNTLDVEGQCRAGTAPKSAVDSDTAWGDCDRFVRPVPVLTLDKTATPRTFSAVDDVINYSYKLTNSGSVMLYAPYSVDDDKILDPNLVDCPNSPASIATGESVTCTASYMITQTDLNNGSVTNIARGFAKDAPVEGGDVASNEDDETVTAETEKVLTLVKTATPTTYDAVGDKIAYSYELINNGNVTLFAPYSVDDDKIVDPNSVDCSGNPASIAPGESVNCAATYTITQDDIENGSVTNIAQGFAKDAPENGTDVPSNKDDETVTAETEEVLTLVKTATPTTYDAVGDKIDYSYELTNNGNLTLYAPYSVDDDKIVDPNSVDCSGNPASIAPGESVNCAATYTITQDDIENGSVTNIAQGFAKDAPQNGRDVPSNKDDETVNGRSISLTAIAECTNDVPWVYYKVETSNIQAVNPGQISYSWVNVDTAPPEIEVVPPTPLTALEGYMLWPGAAATGDYPDATATGWPGWTLADGVWTFTDTDEVPNLVLRVKYDLEDEVSLTYPATPNPCAPAAILEVEKSAVVLSQNDQENTVDVKYGVKVINNGGQSETYDLVDTLMVDEALVLDTIVSNVSYAGGTDGTVETPEAPDKAQFNAGDTLLVDDGTIEAGKHESFEFTLRFKIDGTKTTVEGTDCVADAGEDNTGLTNHVDVKVGSEIVDSAEDCDEFELNPMIELTKKISLDGVGYSASESTDSIPSGAYYQMIVTNTGNIDLVKVRISDPFIPGDDYIFGPLKVGDTETVTFDAGAPATSLGGGPWPALDVDEVCTHTALKENIAIAYGEWVLGGDTVQDDGKATLECSGDPMVSILKQVRVGDGDWFEADDEDDYPKVVYDPVTGASESAEYRLIIANIGNVDLVNVVVRDFIAPGPGGLWSGDKVANGGTLGKDEGLVYITSATPGFGELSVDDVCTEVGNGLGNVVNLAEVEGTDANDPGSKDSATNPAGVKCVGKPAISVLKEVSTNGIDWSSSVSASSGADGYWRFTVTNEGAAELTSVRVIDAQLGIDQVIANIPVNGEVTITSGTSGFEALFKAGYCDTSFSRVNRVDVTAVSVDGGPDVSAFDSATYNCVEPVGDICFDSEGNELGRPESIKMRYEPNQPTFIQDTSANAVNPIIVPDYPYAPGYWPDTPVDIYWFDQKGLSNSITYVDKKLNVTANGSFDVSGIPKNGQPQVAPTTVIHIYRECSSDNPLADCETEGNVLQKIGFHTSCSEVLTPGDRYGAAFLLSAKY
jgi:hypothetical protein